jgi:methylglutamate dehydrogenase subunit C
LTAHGVQVDVIVDSRAEGAMTAGNIPVLRGEKLVDAEGKRRVSHVTVTNDRFDDHHFRTLHVDAIAMSGGWSPVVNLMCHRGAKPVWDESIHAFVPPDVGSQFVAAGFATGRMLLSDALRDGVSAGTLSGKPMSIPQCRDVTHAISPLW